MKRLGLLTGAMAIAALVACGSKSKKPKTTPEAETVEAENPGADAEAKEPAADSDTSGLSTASLGEVIYFEFDKSDLSPESRETLNQNAKWLKEDAKRTLLIEGHTDEVGTPEYNLGLGDRRARAARDYLIRLGIEENRIKIITYGEERPVSNEDPLNRRSVFIATKK